MGGLTKIRPAQPYWYLEVVGVDSTAQGLGIGTWLLEPVLALADETGQFCYLETMTERNVAWYRGLGLEVRDARVRFVRGGPPNWTMIRGQVRDQAGRDRETGGPSEARRGEKT
jgi:ribosomal protein S18 acetylase RimI-like enzyme